RTRLDGAPLRQEFFKPPDDRFDNVLVRAFAAPHVKVGLRVSLALKPRELLERSFGIVGLEQWPGVASRCALGEYVDGSIEPYGYRTFLQQLTRARVHEYAAARGDDPNLSVDQAGNKPPLAVAVIGLPIALEHFTGGQSHGVLDGRIAVDEGQAEPLGQPPSDGRFPDAH